MKFRFPAVHTKKRTHGMFCGGLSRRRVLRGILHGSAITVGLPPLLSIRHAFGETCDDGFPQRFVLFYWGNGNRPDLWTPVGEGSGDAWSLSEELAPLAPIKHKVSVVSGTAVKVPNIIPHWSGAMGFLTGAAPAGTDAAWDVAGPTFDQLLANEIGGDTIYRSLELGVLTGQSISFAGPGAGYPAEQDPYTFFDRIFGSSFREPGSDVGPDPRLAWRRSVLDGVMDGIHKLESQVGAEDRARLENHLDGIRDLEQRLARLQEDPPELEECTRPDAPEVEYPDIDGRAQLAARARAMSDLTAMALACDQTRVLTYNLSSPLTNALFPGVSEGHHTLTHNEGGIQEQVHEITISVMEELSYLLQALDAVPEGDGTMLDHSLVLGTSDVSEGKTHSLGEFPIVMAGGACGAFKNDVHYRSYSQESSSKVLLSILRGFGVSSESFGAGDAYTTDGLSALEG
jgi:hypothetical protein